MPGGIVASQFSSRDNNSRKDLLVIGDAIVLDGALRRRVDPNGPYRILSPGRSVAAGTTADAIVYVVGRDEAGAGRDVTAVLDRAELTGVPVYWVEEAAAGDRTATGVTLQQEDPIAVLRERGHPVVVLRTSIVIGDSRTGAIDEFGALHRLTGALLRAQRPNIPFAPHARIDMIPCDVIADVLIRLIDGNVVDRDYWLTSGAHALTVQQAVAEVYDAARVAGMTLADEAPAFTAGRERPVWAVHPRWRRSAPADADLETSLGNRFENALGELGSLGVTPLPSAREALRASLRFWLASRGPRALARN